MNSICDECLLRTSIIITDPERIFTLGKDTPEGRPVQPGGIGKIVAFPQVGGLHHCYERLAA